MAMNPIFRSSPTRMMGMSSGMDTEFIIQQTLRMHQMKIDTQWRARATLEWRQQTLNGVRDQIADFRRTFLTTQGSTGMLNRLSNVYNTHKATVTGGNNNANVGKVSIRTSTNSDTGTLTINSVNKLAHGAQAVSSNVTGVGGSGLSPTSTLGSLSGLPGTGSGKISFSDDVFKITAGEDGSETTFNIWRDDDGNYFSEPFVDGMPRTAIDFNEGNNFTVELDNGTTLRKLESGNLAVITYSPALDEDGEEIPGEPPVENIEAAFGVDEYGKTSIAVGSGDNIKWIDLSRNDTINSMINKVNASEAGVTMSYDRLKDEFKIETNYPGSSSTDRSTESLTLYGHAFEALGLMSERDPGTGWQTLSNGQNAEAIINGERVERTTNSFEFRGISITLNDTFTEASGTVSVAITRDVTDTVKEIKGFIDAYNSIIKRIEGLTRERKTNAERTYTPLTDEEKSVMTDKQIEEWETIAKKGILANDVGLQNLANNLRAALFETVESAGMRPSDIGLSTGNFFGGTGGQIVLDEDKLRAALEENPDRVIEVFAGIDGNQGLLRRMDKLMGDYVNVSQTRTLKSLEDSIKRANEQMERMQMKMFAEEDRLYKQFAAMETALSQMQSQGDWFSAMLGAGK